MAFLKKNTAATAINLINLNSGNNIIIGASNSGLGGVDINGGTSGYVRALVGGNEYLRVTSAGNVGVGSTTPWGKFSIDTSNLAAGVPEFAVGSSTRQDFLITQSGQAIVGGISQSNAASRALVVSGTNSSGVSIAIQRSDIDSGNSNGARLGYGAASNDFQINNFANGGLTFNTNGAERGRFDTAGNFGVGSTTPWAQLSINPNGVSGPEFAIGSSTGTSFVVTNGGFVGIGTASPTRALTVSGSNEVATFGLTSASSYAAFGGERAVFGYDSTLSDALIQGLSGKGIEFNVNNSTVGLGTAAVINASGFFGIGTTSPYALLTVGGGNPSSASTLFAIASSTGLATSTYVTVDQNGFLAVGSGAGGPNTNISPGNTLNLGNSGIFTVDASSSTTTISNLSVGNLAFEPDAGVVQLSDIPVDANASAGTVESQSISIGGNPLLTAFGLANGSGGVSNLGVGIGTSSPAAMLTVWGGDTAASTQAFIVANAASTTLFAVNDAGNVGVGSTTPWGKFSIDTSNLAAGVPEFTVGSSTRQDFVINQSGNVGIGTSNPSYNLHINSPTVTSAMSFTDSANSSSNGTTNGLFIGLSSATAFIANRENGPLNFFTNNAQRMIIDAIGNVGIGTSTPWAQLSVNPNGVSGPEFAIGSSTGTSFVVNNAGFVGIGTSTPNTNLNIYGTNPIAALDMSSSGSLDYIQFNQNSTIKAFIKYRGTTNTPSDVLQIGTNDTAGSLQLQSANSVPALTITSLQNVGIGTTSPYALLTVGGGNAPLSTATTLFAIASSTGNATSTYMTVDANGFLSIGTGAGLSNNTTIAPGESINTGNSGVFTVDASSGTTTISNLSIGNLTFDTDAGMVNLSDIPVDSNAALGVQQAQILNIGGNPLIVASGISNGAGAVTNLNVGIGTSTTPYSTLQIWGPDSASSTSEFAVVNAASSTVFAVFAGGNAQLAGHADPKLRPAPQAKCAEPRRFEHARGDSPAQPGYV